MVTISNESEMQKTGGVLNYDCFILYLANVRYQDYNPTLRFKSEKRTCYIIPKKEIAAMYVNDFYMKPIVEKCFKSDVF